MTIINCSIHGVGECACTFYPVGTRYTLGGEPIIGRRETAMTPDEEQAEIRRLAEQRRALREVERLMRNGRPVPPVLRDHALGRIEFKSDGATRKR